MTQAEVGDALGLSLVHVNRTLQELRGANLITLQDGMLIVHDWEALQRAAMFEPLYVHLKSDRLSQQNGGSERPSA
jgi:DNA-binding transcriptional regulator LsrR (DeoR family)